MKWQGIVNLETRARSSLWAFDKTWKANLLGHEEYNKWVIIGCIFSLLYYGFLNSAVMKHNVLCYFTSQTI